MFTSGRRATSRPGPGRLADDGGKAGVDADETERLM
jgi:hypothetical protein